MKFLVEEGTFFREKQPVVAIHHFLAVCCTRTLTGPVFSTWQAQVGKEPLCRPGVRRTPGAWDCWRANKHECSQGPFPKEISQFLEKIRKQQNQGFVMCCFFPRGLRTSTFFWWEGSNHELAKGYPFSINCRSGIRYCPHLHDSWKDQEGTDCSWG